jgi:hypothetical protein
MPMSWVDAGVLILVLLTGLLTLMAAYLIWRSGFARGWRSARITPPICPRCGYNLTGLSRCRCPECGDEFQLEQLWQTPIRPRRRSREEGAVAQEPSPEQPAR